MGLGNTIFENPISTNKVKEKLKSADGLIVAMNNLPGLYKYGISFNKLFEYLLAGRPILMTSCTKDNYITEANAGFVSKAEDYKSLAKNILKLIHLTDEERNQYGKNGRKFVIKIFYMKTCL